MSLTYIKAIVAATLEEPPRKPDFIKGTPWRERLGPLAAFRFALARWHRIAALAPHARKLTYIDNGPATPRRLGGSGQGSGALRVPADRSQRLQGSVVHTQPNRAARRAAGARRVAFLTLRDQRMMAAAEARAQVAAARAAQAA